MTINRRMSLAAAAVILALAGMTDAQARGWNRQGSITTPRGTSTYSGSGSCAGGSCSSHGTFVRPNGAVYTRQGTTTCANGGCTSSRSVTGPNGQSVTRSGSVYTTPN